MLVVDDLLEDYLLTTVLGIVTIHQGNAYHQGKRRTWRCSPANSLFDGDLNFHKILLGYGLYNVYPVVIKHGLLENPSCIDDFPNDKPPFTRNFPDCHV